MSDEGGRTPMDRETWARVQDLFHDALDLAAAERRAFVLGACGDDVEVAERVLALLAEDGRAAGLLDRGLGDVASAVLDAPGPGPSRIGPYRVIRLLGRGGMGLVYLAERPDLGLRAAIKVLRDAALSPARRDRFASEQRTLAALTHPRIARLYDADLLQDGTPYFVMEYVEGEALDQFCARGALTARARLELFRSVCEAVQHAHGRAVIHRDLKPSNIVVTDGGEPKLLDFGIAKHLEAVDHAQSTETGFRMMTPAYAAPEQLLGEPLGVYTDVYALGVILYEILTGRPPYDLGRLTPGRAERAVLETEAPPPSTRVREALGDEAEQRGAPPPDVGTMSRAQWEDLDVLCGTAMHRDVERRYPSVEALTRDIDHFLGGQPLEARPDSASYRLAKFARRNARPLALAGMVALTLASTVGFYTWRLAEARDRALAEAARTRRIQRFTTSLFEGGDEVVGPADTLRVLTLLERGVQEARLLSDEPVPQSEMYVTLGTIYTQLGRLERADSLLAVALGVRRALDPADPRGVAEAERAIGELRIQEGRYEEARAILEDALGIERGLRPRDDAAVAGTLTTMGVALEGLGEYERSVAVLEEAVRSYDTRGEDGADLSAAITALATTHFYAGDLDAADSLNRRALAIDRRLYGDGHPTVADDLINLAAAEGQRGRYPEAEVFFREAASILEAYHGPDHPETASALRMLGANLIYQSRLDEAEPLLERALRIQERALPPEHPRLANTMGDLAFIRLRRGDYDEAVELYRRIVHIYEVSNGERHHFVAIGLSNLANALMEGGHLEEAEAILRDVLVRLGETRASGDLDAGIAHVKLGRVLLRRGDPAAAEAELLAGYEIVAARAAPTVSWLRSARSDLVAAYDALGRPDRAEHFRLEQQAVDSAGTGR